MGLDIHIAVNNYEEIYDENYFNNNFHHSLSREFCNLKSRKNVINHKPELDQISEITGIDISILYEMENYPDEGYIQSMIDYYNDNEEKKKEIISKAEEEKKKLIGNLNEVLKTINNMITQLAVIDDLYKKLMITDFDTLNSEYYFSNFNEDIGDGYIGNNFGQDLRNFKRFLEYAKERNSITVWFNYG